MKVKECTLAELMARFPDDDACLDFLFKQRYAKIPCCPKCGVVNAAFYRIQGRRCYACMHCRYQLYPTAGTIMHRSPTPLRSWFIAVYLMAVSKNNVAAMELKRQLGVTYKCAWRMEHKIRIKMTLEDSKLLKGIVEVDEAYIGGRRRSSNRFSNKTPLFGMVERGGGLRIEVTDHASATTALDFLRRNLAKGSTLHTDESRIYYRAHQNYKHETVAHGNGEYVRGDAYTNTIEGVWGLLKPSWTGTHRWVSRKYMVFYAGEFVWRYNRRKETQLFQQLLEAVAQPL